MSVKRFLDTYFGPSNPDSTTPGPSVIPRSSPSLSQSLSQYRSPSVTESISGLEASPRTFHIFTDGACSDNGRRGAKGGFGVHIYSKKGLGLDVSRRLLATEAQTNNRGELRAIQAALDILDTHATQWSTEYDDYCIWSDSEYSIHSLTKWCIGWKRNGWKKSDGGVIQNVDLIKPISEKLARMPRVRLRHVRAHQRGREHEFPYDGNTEADRLATSSLTTESSRYT